MLQQGFELMLVGMGTVFTFLTTLVFAMNLLARVAARIEPAHEQDGATAEEVAAITAAITMHRRRRRQSGAS